MSRELSLVDSLFKIFHAPRVPECPFEEVKTGEIVIGVIDDAATKNLLAEMSHFYQEANVLHEEHDCIHRSGQDHTAAECRNLMKDESSLIYGGSILNRLFLEGVHASIDDYRDEIKMRANWQVILVRNGNDAAKMLVDRSHPSMTFFEDVRNAMFTDAISSEELEWSNSRLGPIDHMDEECIIAQVTSPTLMALHMVTQRLIESTHEENYFYLPPGFDLVDLTGIVQTLHARIKMQMDLSSQLFWRGVLETLPSALRGVSKLGIRRDWNIVSVPKTDEEHRLEKIFSSDLDKMGKRYGEFRGVEEEPPESEG